MPTPLHQKLRIKENDTLLTLHAPADFKKSLGTIPSGVSIIQTGKTYTQVHWFVTTQAQLKKELSGTLKLVKEGITVWVYYPKGSSGMQTDLTRDKGWECLEKEAAKLTWINLISFNDTWSAFGFRAKTTADKKKDVQPKVEREIFKWVNPQTKEVTIPVELEKALKKNKKLHDYFHALAFSHKKEYIEWIVTAKKEETKQKRVAGTIELLEKGWKNPRNQ